MRKSVLGLFLAAAVLVMSAAAVAVPSDGKPAYNGLNHGGRASQLMLYEKDSGWGIVEGGAWGKLTYSDSGFVFNGHRLDAGAEYQLVNYADSWPVAECLGGGVVNAEGNVHIMGDGVVVGTKVWLVLAGDVNCEGGVLTGWNPSEYLFEYNTI